MHKVCDTMFDLERECRSTHPDVADKIRFMRLKLGRTVNELMNDGISMCPEDE